MSRGLSFAVRTAALVVLIGAVGVGVWLTGGVKYVFSHSMYLAILLGGYFFGTRGGLLTAIAGGLILGPWMPLDAQTGEMQNTMNWVYRLVWFSVIGVSWGIVMDSLRETASSLQMALTHFPGTGIPSMTMLDQTVRQIYADPDSSDEVGLAVCSIDNIGELIGTFGRKIENQIVLDLAERIGQVCTDDIRIFQESSDRLLLLCFCNDGSYPQRFSRMIREVSTESFIVNDIPVHLEIKIGFAHQLIDIEDDASHHLVRKALLSLDTAKANGDEFFEYSSEIDFRRNEGIELLGDLRDAILKNELYLEYQGKFRIGTKQLIGAEALIRWNHSRKGRIPPGKFIPKVETSDLIHPVTQWVLQHSVLQLEAWRGMGFNAKIAINVSSRNLNEPDFAVELRELLEKYHIPSDQVELEVTESSLMREPGQVIDVLNQLSGIPIALSIDDFGTGYSSLQYLNLLPATSIKIDRAFFAGIENDPSLFQIVRAAVRIGHSLNLEVVAEGIETEEQLLCAQEAGCDVVQGFYIHKPSSAEQLVSQFGDAV